MTDTTNLKQVALSRALTILGSIGCKYIIVDAEGNEHILHDKKRNASVTVRPSQIS